MTRRARSWLAVAGILVLAGAAAWAVTDIAPSGEPPGDNARQLPQLLAHERQAANIVNGVTYDLRGADTLGEELILFVAALGSAVLLRHGRGDPEGSPESGDDRPATAGALRAAGAVLVGPVVVLGIYVVTHGHLSPGGGFQGGVVLAAALLLVYAAGQVIALRRVEPTALVEVGDATGALAFAIVAVAGIVGGGAALWNFLPYGSSGALLSAGTIPVLSVAVGAEVTGAVALVMTEFLDQALLRGRA
jgi:multicomponent Na+:H+ antiporter subunit B